MDEQNQAALRGRPAQHPLTLINAGTAIDARKVAESGFGLRRADPSRPRNRVEGQASERSAPPSLRPFSCRVLLPERLASPFLPVTAILACPDRLFWNRMSDCSTTGRNCRGESRIRSWYTFGITCHSTLGVSWLTDSTSGSLGSPEHFLEEATRVAIPAKARRAFWTGLADFGLSRQDCSIGSRPRSPSWVTMRSWKTCHPRAHRRRRLAAGFRRKSWSSPVIWPMRPGRFCWPSRKGGAARSLSPSPGSCVRSKHG